MQRERVQIAGTAATDLAPVTAAHGLDVDVTRLPALVAGSANIGDVDIASIQKSATGTLANVSASATNVTLQASNASRLGWMIYNDSTSILYVKLAATASATSFTVRMLPEAYYELPGPHIYTGIIDGIWVSANGSARVTELT